mmetsp:Transcript_15111/g.23356  ORF Transcript_15111/g.23356 Transcript_15111/m.23356 type:complete len:267 (+) Transcript_15111:1127-1927(+)|eukprot:CAMPEP_0170492590 /NCGR_PEP_ID=MMETSP0208-20121228/12467_1 /TAXON_ID=197538 /ORGANISM="Strombidium inclinatum, Strain S3" /LENGTH=266 /DNA_ID=CAMNT_0010768357 /DNA_START=1108 /DNA_END=1908 /DNA_ORIENTATION=-
MLDTHLHVVKYCFESNPLFEMQRASGFESFVNFELGQYTLSEMLSTYSDQILRKNGFKADQEEYEQHLDKIVKLFSHLSDKDIFISSFKIFLARRLLMEKSENIDYEKFMITKLKINCGRQVTDSIEGMINDLETGKGLANEYKQDRQAKEMTRRVDFDIKVLTTCHWPTYKSFELKVPIEINNCIDDFSAFYSKRPQNNHKKLDWNFSMGTALVGAKISETQKYDLLVSTYQMCILYLFNYDKQLTLAEIADHMGFDEETCKKNV